jgi:crotonobetaine/carnitine-CoA ligase
VNSPETIAELVEASASAHAGRPWLHWGGTSFTFQEAAERANGAARYLAELGVEPGSVVASVLPNGPEAIFVWFGLMQLGAIHLPLNPRATPAELAGALGHAEPIAVISRPDTEPTIVEAQRHLDSPARLADAADVVAEPSPTALQRAVRPEDPAVLIQTSGTTGRPKLVVQAHRTYVMTAEGFPWWLGLGPDDHMLTCLPLFHFNAQGYSTLGSLFLGVRFTLLERFSRSTFWDSVRRSGATQFNFIGAMIEMFMQTPPTEDDGRHAVRIIFGGPTPERDRHLEFERRFNLTMMSGYALSESPYGMVWPRDEPPPYGSIGRLRQHPRLGRVNEARVVDDQGAPVEAGAVGELLLRNPTVMLGYYRLPEETDATVRDGWLHTGDLVRQDENGVYSFLGRKKEVIRRRGENLSPREVELVLEQHPAVAECAVVGVPDPLSEEEVKAFVLPADGAALSGKSEAAASLRQWCSERLTAYKVPRYYEFVTEFPRTPTKRIAKHQLPRDRTPAEIDWTAEGRNQSHRASAQS